MIAKLPKQIETAGRVFAVGDIHGCFEELNELLTQLRFEQKLTIDDQVIFLGDYIDRGPNSKTVISLLLQFKKQFPKTVFLKGNHEDMFLGFLLGDQYGNHGSSWLMNGGTLVCSNYGVDDNRLNSSQTIRDTLNKMPQAHLKFLHDLEDWVQIDNFIFVHAGIDPEHSLDKQRLQDLFWQRDYFYINIVNNSIAETIIHGHTPTGVHFDLPYRINLDSSCVFGGQLSCLELNRKDPINSTLYQIESKQNKIHLF